MDISSLPRTAHSPSLLALTWFSSADAAEEPAELRGAAVLLAVAEEEGAEAPLFIGIGWASLLAMSFR